MFKSTFLREGGVYVKSCILAQSVEMHYFVSLEYCAHSKAVIIPTAFLESDRFSILTLYSLWYTITYYFTFVAAKMGYYLMF